MSLMALFQSTLPVGGATSFCQYGYAAKTISIHAPRGGSDFYDIIHAVFDIYFNPRSPWGERQVSDGFCNEEKIFQSTLPVGGATEGACYHQSARNISIHAPRGGSDRRQAKDWNLLGYFNPRSPWGERPQYLIFAKTIRKISLHAPRGGSDPQTRSERLLIDISIHAPRGGSDWLVFSFDIAEGISIHAPRGGSDSSVESIPPQFFNFNPRSPWGERPQSEIQQGAHRQISIHAPRGGSDDTTCFILWI